MDTLLSAAFDNAVLVSLLAVAVLVVERFARRPALSHCLWILLLLKLVTPPLVTLHLALPEVSQPLRLAPASLPGPAAIQRVPPSRMTIEAVRAFEKTSRAAEPRSTNLADRAAALSRAAAAQVPLVWSSVVVGLWLTGSGFLLCWSVVRLVQIGRHLDAATPAPMFVQTLAKQVAMKLGLKRSPLVGLVPCVMSPAVVAVGRRPRLMLPLELWGRLDQEQQTALLAHELAHLRRRDHWVRLLELAAISLYWWFPVAWWIRRSLQDAEEQCCDAWVVWALPGLKRAYARTLLDTVDFLAGARFMLPFGAAGMGTRTVLKRRLSSIMRDATPRTLTPACSVALVSLAVLTFPLTLRHAPAGGFARGYQIIDLGRFSPTAINNAGQIAGNAMDSRIPRPYLWDRGRWTDLGGPEGTIAFAADINDLGQVAGSFSVPRGARAENPTGKNAIPRVPIEFNAQYQLGGARLAYNLPCAAAFFQVFDDANRGRINARYSDPHAFRTSPFRPLNPLTDDLGTLGGSESYALAINNLGQVAGASTADNHDGPEYQVLYLFRTAANQPIVPQTDVLYLGRDTDWDRHIAMNNQGEVVFHVPVKRRSPSETWRSPPVRNSPGGAIEPRTDDLGPKDEPAVDAEAYSINDRGQVVGESPGRQAATYRRGFRTAAHQPIHLAADELRGLVSAHAINNHGQVLGAAPGAWPPWNNQAIHDGKAPYRLSDLIPSGSGWMIVSAGDLNDRGQIVGWGLNPQGQGSGFLLEPTPSDTALYWLLAGTLLTGLGQAVGRIGSRGG
jgi:beta-lactamase regulating signal transducer with metallopeptidase domain/uncharacterized membrane protein